MITELLQEVPVSPAPELPDFGSQVASMMLALGAVLALILVLARYLPRALGQRIQRAPKGDRIVIEETLRLEPRRTLYLLRVDGKPLLIGSSEQGLVRLDGGSQADPQELLQDRPEGSMGSPTSDDVGATWREIQRMDARRKDGPT